jgi:hypothetical protein
MMSETSNPAATRQAAMNPKKRKSRWLIVAPEAINSHSGDLFPHFGTAQHKGGQADQGKARWTKLSKCLLLNSQKPLARKL